ncbi:ezrin/radixin/moesin family domain-containing protein [Ditylenchus destructor]|uniref:Moesin/ezrin/radixin homolog 1 n=1 Tax=Ditylenchus destructor TaxID=166010 RepID=A0AAD4R5F1_9BILA|nr:ezrin/radixin/moesin family domain-containing protein [Ditylenchus destructor]
MDLLVNRNKKLVKVTVTTMDADLSNIMIEANWTGRQLFDTVCRIIGLREIWYFGLRFSNKKELPCWLQMDKKINQQDVPKQADGSLHFLFLVKFYPESVEDELIQDLTRHLFFLQIKQSILSQDLYCQPEAAVLLASYAVQAMYGDCYDNIELELDKLLPQTVIDQFDMSSDMWEERIRKWWGNNGGLSTEEAEMEYLRVAQDLDMYGIQYYTIYNQKDTDLLLGVSAQGIGIYELDNRLSPRPFFPWTEIKNISFQNKVFTITTHDKSKIKFRARDCSINMSILDLCIGTHNLYLRRRQPDLLEIQQMKIQAKEQRQRRLTEQNKFMKERELRQKAEADRDRYKMEITILTEQVQQMQNVMKNTEETHKLIAEKARVSEKEALELSKRASEAEAEVQRVKLSQMKAEETKMALERKVRDVEMVAHRLMQDNERHNRENQYRSQVLHNSQQAWPPGYLQHQEANISNLVSPLRHSHAEMLYLSSMNDDNYKNLMNKPSFLPAKTATSSTTISSPPLYTERPPTNSMQTSFVSKTPPNGLNAIHNIPPPTAVPENEQFVSDTQNSNVASHVSNGTNHLSDDYHNFKAELENSRKEYDEFLKNKRIKERLMEFRNDLEKLKLEDKETELDRIYASNLQCGFDKYSTLRKSGAGSAKHRVKVYEGL